MSAMRMGTPKADLVLAGKTFFERVAEAARDAFDRVIAVERAGERARAIETIFESDHEDEAPIFAVRRAIEHADAKCFVVGVDYPLITSDVLRMLRARFERSEKAMFVPMHGGFAQVLVWRSSR